MIGWEKLQHLIDAYVLSEEGAEIVRDFQVEYGPLSGMFFDDKEGVVRFELVTDPHEYVSEKRFPLYDYVEQKAKRRLVLRALDGTVYVIRPIQSDFAMQLNAAFGPNEEQKRQIRVALMPYEESAKPEAESGD